MKKILMVVLSIICVTCFSLFFIGCNNENDNDNANNNDQIVEIYNTYVAYAESNGATPLSYEDWLASIKGEKGDTGANGQDGKDGQDGITPTIEIIDGYWYINGENSGVKAEGKDGVNGTNGTNGTTPTIEIINSYWYINGENTGVKAEGKDGINGTNGVGIKSVDFDEEGRLVIILTDDTVLPTIEMPEKEEHIHSFGEWIDFTGGESVPCQDRLYYHICSNCSSIEWRQGCESDHSLTEEYVSDYIDNANHYHICLTCGVYRNSEEHDFNDEAVCTICNYELPYSEGLEIDNQNGDIVVKSIGTCKDINIRIPSSYNDEPIVSIYNGAFKGANIKNMFISSIENISAEAFEGSLVEKIVFADDISLNISSEAFQDTKNLETIIFGENTKLNYLGGYAFCRSSLKHITLPEGITNIVAYTFAYCKELEEVIFPASLTKISYGVFVGCSKLKHVEIPDGIEDVFSDIFHVNYTPSLSYNVKNGIKYLGNATNPYVYLYGFVDGWNETEVNIPEGCKYIGGYAFNKLSSLRKITISSTVKVIGAHAFQHCENVEEIDIPDNVKIIKTSAFSYCSSLSSIQLSENLSIIESFAFTHCTSLREVKIPDSITEISEGLFIGCSSIEKVNIGINVIKINERVFDQCASFSAWVVSPENTNYKTIDGNLYSKDGKTLINYASGKTNATFEIPTEVEIITKFAFRYNNNLRNITIGKNVNTIENYAVSLCYNLESINYLGTKEEWNLINTGSSFDNVKIIYCTDGEIVLGA